MERREGDGGRERRRWRLGKAYGDRVKRIQCCSEEKKKLKCCEREEAESSGGKGGIDMKKELKTKRLKANRVTRRERIGHEMRREVRWKGQGRAGQGMTGQDVIHDEDPWCLGRTLRHGDEP